MRSEFERRFKAISLDLQFDLLAEALMKISQTLTPAVILLAFGVGLGLAFVMQRAATAETHAAQTVRPETHADASLGVSPICEDREVEMDEGYALTRKERRRVCH
jgi:hypothetical protein